MKEPTMAGFVFGLLGIVLTLFTHADTRADRMESRFRNVQEQAIERGYALHCPADGEFAWVGECEQKGEE